ncbi:MAG: hypothetical protein AAFN81_04930 [Bacteroidota bacterium]
MATFAAALKEKWNIYSISQKLNALLIIPNFSLIKLIINRLHLR